MNSVNLTRQKINQLLSPYGTEAGGELCESMRLYISTLLLWNSKIALTTVTDVEEIVRIHFGESFFAARAARISDGRVADIGTGAGFPGIPIRMVADRVKLSLVEPIAKKTAFLGEIVRKLGLSGVDIIRCRMEDLPPEKTEFDFVTARALGEYRNLAKWAGARLSQGGQIILLIGGAELHELQQLKEWNWQEPLAIPESKAKFVLIGRRL